MIVYLLQEAFAQADKPLPANAIMKITGHDRHKEQHIREFKNEEFPNIIVTVDLLTTGIDVPSLMNLVFMRRVKSRILFEQMIGRATRLFPGMDCFNIYDAVGQFASMEKVTDMNAVIHEKNVNRSVGDLFQLVTEAEDEGDFAEYRDQLIATVQRKLHRLNEKDRKSLETATGVRDLFEWARSLEKSNKQAMVKEEQAILLIDAFRGDSRKVLISHQDDKLVSVRQSYGKTGEGPGDYLEEFDAFIKNNVNAIAGIGVIVNRPRDLTLKELQQIDAILQAQGFRERDLQSAWRQVNKEATAANIISFIRQAALGTPLESEEALVERAMSKVYGLAEWTPTQMKWLERIKKQLLLNNVLGPNAQVAFDSNDAFRSRGGYKGMQRIFKDKTDEIVDVINNIIFA